MFSTRNTSGSKGSQDDTTANFAPPAKRIDALLTPPRPTSTSSKAATPVPSPPKICSVLNKPGPGEQEETPEAAKQRKQEAFQADRTEKLKKANAIFQASLPYRYYPDGSFKVTTISDFFKKNQRNVWEGVVVPKHYFSKKDGSDKKSIHNICAKAVPTPFSLVHRERPWRKGTQNEFDELTKVCLAAKARWTKEEHGQKLRDALIGLASTSPEAFDDLYGQAGTLSPSPETLLWMAANKTLGSK